MSKFFIPNELSIEGGNPAFGEISISGAKNSILGLMAAAVLTDEKVTLHNVPYISDVLEMGHILIDLGVDVKFNPESKVLSLHAKKIKKNILSEKAVKFRASYYLWGALLARFKHTGEFNSLKVLLPGGCAFGAIRPTDFHEQLVKTVFGAEIIEEKTGCNHYLIFNLPREESKDLCPIYTTAKVSHGATFHWLLSIAGTSHMKMMYNASLEPEVSNLVTMLQKMGLDIDGSDRTGIIYKGNNKGLLKGGDFYTIPDRMEAATYALLAMGTKGAINLKGINQEHCAPWLLQLSKIYSRGIYYSADHSEIVLDFRDLKDFDGVIMQMSPFPGMETDVQQIWTAVLGLAKSESTIVDIIWPGRSAHLEEMKKLGLKAEYNQIEVDAGQGIRYQALIVKIKPSKLHSGTVHGTELRGTTGMMVMSAIAKGKSTIQNPSFTLRGYPNLVKNLKSLGINIHLSKSGENIEELPLL